MLKKRVEALATKPASSKQQLEQAVAVAVVAAEDVVEEIAAFVVAAVEKTVAAAAETASVAVRSTQNVDCQPHSNETAMDASQRSWKG